MSIFTSASSASSSSAAFWRRDSFLSKSCWTTTHCPSVFSATSLLDIDSLDPLSSAILFDNEDVITWS